MTWILPLLIVLLASPSTALLTRLFLPQSYKAELPSLSYLTFLDCLPAYSYMGSLLLFMLFLWGTNVLAEAADQDKGEAWRRMNGRDRICQLTAFVGFFVIAIWAWIACWEQASNDPLDLSQASGALRCSN